MHDLSAEAIWPSSRLPELIQEMARLHGMDPESRGELEVPELPSNSSLRAWERRCQEEAERSGLDFDSDWMSYSGFARQLRRSAPGIFPIRNPGAGAGFSFVAVSGTGAGRCKVLRTDGSPLELEVGSLRSIFAAELEGSLQAELKPVLDNEALPMDARARLSQTLRDAYLGDRPIARAWLLRPPAALGIWRHFRQMKVPTGFAKLIGLHLLSSVLWLVSWWMMGAWALEGRFDSGWFSGWILLVLTLVPIRYGVAVREGELGLRIGSVFRKRLLGQSARLRAERVQAAGVGGVLSRVLESEALENLALKGGLTSLFASIELALGVSILLASGMGWFFLPGFLAVAGFAGLIAYRLASWRRRWTSEAGPGSRLGLGQSLLEVMVGHRTRLIQQSPESWHPGEDRRLEQYHELSVGMDRNAVLLTSVVPRAWLFMGLLGLGLSVYSDSRTSATLAIGLGGVLLIYSAVTGLTQAISDLIDARICLSDLKRFFSRDALLSDKRPAWVSPPEPSSQGSVLLGRNLELKNPRTRAALLKDVHLTLKTGDRVLLTGPSGSGKSSLAALLAGQRESQGGILLLDGLDPATLGSRNWRKRIALVPQYHENHIYSECLAFNLLMGRAWPPTGEDLQEARALCHELGLDDLLEAMPSGLFQQVGDGGWRLSQGERSRIFLARALLQDSDVIILDETFAALDSRTSVKVMECLDRRAKAILVIAHP
jgi:ATP-binding cassette subfamily B protein